MQITKIEWIAFALMIGAWVILAVVCHAISR